MLGAIKGEMTLQEACEQLKCATRRYAKRQLTWFRNKADAYTLYVDGEDGIRPISELKDEAVIAAQAIIKDLRNNQ